MVFFIILLTIFSLFQELNCITLPVWYQTPRFWGEPRLLKNYQNWIETFVRTGFSEHGYNARGCCTSIDNFLPKTNSLTIFDLESQYTKNFINGFFLQAVLPIRVLHSNETENLSNGQLGDTLLTAGWGINYQNFRHLDFLDVTLQTGAVLPSGSLCYHKSFCECAENDYSGQNACLATGYNGNTGFIANIQAALGLLDWLTLGGHWAVFHFKNCGYPFNVISYGFYGKADHVINGLSIILAGVRNKESHNGTNIWRLNTFNIFIEYDFACLHDPYRPTFGLLFDIARKGQCSLPTTMYGIYFNVIF